MFQSVVLLQNDRRIKNIFFSNEELVLFFVCDYVYILYYCLIVQYKS